MSRNVLGFQCFDAIAFGAQPHSNPPYYFADPVTGSQGLIQQLGTSAIGYNAYREGEDPLSEFAKFSCGNIGAGNSGYNSFKVSNPVGSGYRETKNKQYWMWFWQGKIISTDTTATVEGKMLWGTCGESKSTVAPWGAVGVMAFPDSTTANKFDLCLVQKQAATSTWVNRLSYATVTLAGSLWETDHTWALVVDRTASPMKAIIIYWDPTGTPAWKAYAGQAYHTLTSETTDTSLEAIGNHGGASNDSSANNKGNVHSRVKGVWTMEQDEDWTNLDTGSPYSGVDNEVHNWRCVSRYPSDDVSVQWTPYNACGGKNYTCLDDIKDWQAQTTPLEDYLTAGSDCEDKYSVRSIPSGAKLKAISMAGPVDAEFSGSNYYGPEYFRVYDNKTPGYQDLAPTMGIKNPTATAFAFFPTQSDGTAWTTADYNSYVKVAIRNTTVAQTRKIWGLCVGLLGVDILQGDIDTCGKPYPGALSVRQAVNRAGTF